MIINIRGTNGSGKTTMVRRLIEQAKHVKWFQDFDNPDQRNTIRALILKLPRLKRRVWIVGPYDSSASGGCDRIRTQEEVCRLVRRGYKKGYHVVFEGIIISTIWGRYAEMADRYGKDFMMVFLDTPFKRCLKHIRRRQKKSGRGVRPIKVEQVRAKYDLVKRHRRMAKEERIRHRVVSYKRSDSILRLLQESEQ